MDGSLKLPSLPAGSSGEGRVRGPIGGSIIGKATLVRLAAMPFGILALAPGEGY